MELELLKMFNRIAELADAKRIIKLAKDGDIGAVCEIIGRISGLAQLGNELICHSLPTPDTMLVNATSNGVKGFNPYME